MKHIDFDRAFAQTPGEIHESILTAFEKGEKKMKLRYKIISAVSAAAVLLAAFGVIALAGREMSAPKPDTLAAPALKATQINSAAENSEEAPRYTALPPTASPTEEPAAHAEEWSVTPEPTPTVQPTPGPENEEFSEEEGKNTPTPAPATMTPMVPVDAASGLPRGVYCTEGGKYYHTDENCSGMRNAGFVGIETAAACWKLPCPVCCNFDIYVYANPKGTYYHAYKQCSGMQGAEGRRINDGILEEKQACLLCIPDSAFADIFGTLYHTESDCSGMMTAHSITGYVALHTGKAPCPVCIEPDIRAQ